ncbi:MAG: hypothetical protein HY658_07210 [Actinobacteria bacterium]|nr:hypothetical protein [Actinomycetota bacterium]
MGQVATRSPSPTGIDAPPRRRGWGRPLVAFLVALALAGAVAWLVPRAAEADRLADRGRALREEVSAASAALEAARARLEGLREELARESEIGEALSSDSTRQGRRIEALQRKVGALVERVASLTEQGEEAERRAAEEAARAATPSGGGGGPLSVEPPNIEYCLTGIDAKTGQEIEVCYQR